MMKSARNILFFLILLTIPAAVSSLPLSSFTVVPEKIKESVYREKYSTFAIENNSNFVFKNRCSQKILRSEKHGQITKTLLRTGPFRSAVKPLRSELADTPLLNLKDPLIISASEKLKKYPAPLSAVSRFVFRHINDKVTGIPIVPASWIFRNRSGDCTEHAVLAVSLFRAMKIPARAVAGMVLVRHMGGKKNLMVYHMWAEAYYRGRWRIVDPTRSGRVKANRYIAFCTHSLKTEMPADYMKALASIYGMRVVYGYSGQ